MAIISWYKNMRHERQRGGRYPVTHTFLGSSSSGPGDLWLARLLREPSRFEDVPAALRPEL